MVLAKEDDLKKFLIEALGWTPTEREIWLEKHKIIEAFDEEKQKRIEIDKLKARVGTYQVLLFGILILLFLTIAPFAAEYLIIPSH